MFVCLAKIDRQKHESREAMEDMMEQRRRRVINALSSFQIGFLFMQSPRNQCQVSHYANAAKTERLRVFERASDKKTSQKQKLLCSSYLLLTPFFLLLNSRGRAELIN